MISKNTIVVTSFIGVVVLILFSSYQNGSLNYNTILKTTGAPGEYTCNYCHTTYADNSGPGSIVVNFNNGINSYIPGNTYYISVNMSGSSINKYGFQMTSLSSQTNLLAGKFLPSTGTDTFYLAQSSQSGSYRRYIEQNSPGTGSWTFQWEAPTTNEGDITLYFTGVAAQYPTGISGDYTYSGSVTISPLSAPVADFTASDTDICEGETVSLTSNTPNADSLIWNISGATPSTSNAPTTNATFNSQGQYTVQLIAMNAIGTDTMTKTQYINVSAPPAAVAVAQSTTCFGSTNGCININTSGSYSYNWSNGATTSDICNLPAGNYCVTVTNSIGCETVICETVTEPDMISVAANVTHDTGSGGAISLNVSGGAGNYTYSWSNGATTKDISGVPAGIYTVTVTDQNSCFTTHSASINGNTVGIDNSEAVNIAIYPNPASERLYISARDVVKNIQIVSLNGAVVHSRQMNTAGGRSVIDISKIAKGVYFVDVTTDEGTLKKKILIY